MLFKYLLITCSVINDKLVMSPDTLHEHFLPLSNDVTILKTLAMYSFLISLLDLTIVSRQFMTILVTAPLELVLHVISTKLPANNGNSLSDVMKGPLISITRSYIICCNRYSTYIFE